MLKTHAWIKQYLLLFHGKDGFANAPKYYIYTYIAGIVVILSLFPSVPISSYILNQFPVHVSTFLQVCFIFYPFFCVFIYLLPGPSCFLSRLNLSPTFIFVFLHILVSSSVSTFPYFNLYFKLYF